MSDRLSNVIRRKFVDYFTTKHNHKFVPSSPVLPKNDKSISFVNAGMNQFKSLFIEDRVNYSTPRVCNYQKCIRVGGKLGDLDLIGHDLRHHTFFEMLGNWSFNDYGKHECCEWALDFLVNHLKLDSSKITTTYLVSEEEEDSETRDIWLKLGIPSDRVIGKGAEDNFWDMGTFGPCGPSSEIFYPIGPDQDNLLEIWNLVFIDRQRLPDVNETVPLRSKFVDTGMGLERILSLIENVESNYDTDLFKDHFSTIQAKSNVEPYGGSLTDESDINYRILADHSRMITIALADGVEPGRRGNEYELRSIIKKCVDISRDIFKQETPRYLLFDLFDATVTSLAQAYPELTEDKIKDIRRTIAYESKRYLHMSRMDDIRNRGKDIRNIKQFLRMQAPKDNQTNEQQKDEFCIHGRVANFRSYKKFHFVDLEDGSSVKPAQIVIDRDLLDKPQIGSYLSCKGQIVASKGQMQAVEFKVDKLIYQGACEPENYPLATVPEESLHALRRQIHLRPRVPIFTSLLRVRSEMEMALHMIMKQMDFFRVHTPIISSNDSEASSDLFTIQRSKIMRSQAEGVDINGNQSGSSTSCNQIVHFGDKDDLDEGYGSEKEVEDRKLEQEHKEDMSSIRIATKREEEQQKQLDQHQRLVRDDYFKKDVFLVTSAQLHLECLASSLSRVYTLSPAFRAENSQTRRHLSEFLMFEAEEANVYELNALMDRVETIVKFLAQYITQISDYKDDAWNLIETNDSGKIYDKLSNSQFVRLDYRRALSLLREKTTFSGSTQYGCDISRDHEQKLLEYHDNVPIFITNYPKRLKPFYMKTHRQEALCFDLIAPLGGEICGGSLREDDLDRLIASIKRHQLSSPQSANDLDDDDDLKKFNWYLDIRRYGSFPHGGFGIGFERLIKALMGIKNIKDTTAFPRWPGHCPM